MFCSHSRQIAIASPKIICQPWKSDKIEERIQWVEVSDRENHRVISGNKTKYLLLRKRSHSQAKYSIIVLKRLNLS